MNDLRRRRVGFGLNMAVRGAVTTRPHACAFQHRNHRATQDIEPGLVARCAGSAREPVSTTQIRSLPGHIAEVGRSGRGQRILLEQDRIAGDLCYCCSGEFSASANAGRIQCQDVPRISLGALASWQAVEDTIDLCQPISAIGKKLDR